MPRESWEALMLDCSEDDGGDQSTGANETRAPLPAVVRDQQIQTSNIWLRRW